MKKRDICRALTFISYNIPIAKEFGTNADPDYSTIGFFDGLFSKSIDMDYSQKNFKDLWEYSIEMSLKSEGKYSYQNIFMFSKDEWNYFEDENFWCYESDVRYPLTYVIFFQLSRYCTENNTLEQQIRGFNEKLKEELAQCGIFYSYITIDKNDIVVCIKSDGYRKVLEAIKKLHIIDKHIIYSYTTLSINNSVLKILNKEKYENLYNETIDSISLKGVTNSYGLDDELTLEKKYRELASGLRSVFDNGEDSKFEIYDILGDDDFRFVAHDVNLGELLEQYGEYGRLSYHSENSHLRFYLYSSSMRLNVRNCFLEKEEIASDKVIDVETAMNSVLIPRLCNDMEKELEEIRSYIQKGEKKYLKDEKIVTFCQALWQILQSLKALERAPTKHYDFYTLYIPFRMFILMLNEKLKNNEELGEKENIYDFIHKISMTLQGTLKTDIQFFQINDYNAISHYAPSKLRAFYSAWTLKLSEFYDLLSEENSESEYSFVFSPGVFKGTQVRELFEGRNEKKHLMLITIPERHIYVPKWMTIILGHEVGHFVGHELRNREVRRFKLMEIATRIIILEWGKSVYSSIKGEFESSISDYICQEQNLETLLKNQMSSEMRSIDGNNEMLHSEETLYSIKKCLNRIMSLYGDEILEEYSSFLDIYMNNMEEKNRGINVKHIQEIRRIIYRNEDIWRHFVIYLQETETMDSALRLVKYIMSEMFSDLMSILTLGLYPEDYIFTFEKSEYLNKHLSITEDTYDKSDPVHVRIAIVIAAVKELVSKNKSAFEKEYDKFIEKWVKFQYEDLVKKLPNGSIAQDLVIYAYGYQRRVCNYKNNIEEYVSLYEQRFDKSRHMDAVYLLDEKIYQDMFQYLLKCGADYLQRVCKEMELKKRRRELRENYILLAEGEPCKIIQGIEEFLYTFEKDTKDV